MANKQNEKLLINLGILAIAYFGVIRPILNKIGITKSKEAREAETTIKAAESGDALNNPWDPNFYKKAPAGSLVIRVAEAIKRADLIYNCSAPNYLYQDDEACIVNAITSLKTQSQVSFLADQFQKKYNTSLILFLQKGRTSAPWAGLSEAELTNVIDNVRKKPKYKL